MPDVFDQVHAANTDTTGQTGSTATGDVFDQLHADRTGTTGNVAGDFLSGFGAGVIQIPVGLYDMARKIPGLDRLPEPSPYIRSLTHTPDTTAGKLGRAAENFAEFAVPAGEAAKATEGLGLIPRMAAQAGVGAGVGAVDSGGQLGPAATGAAIGAAGPVVEDLAPYALRFGKTAAAEVLGRSTGAGAAAVRQAFENPTPELINAMRGQTSEKEILQNFRDALQNVKDARSADYQAKLAQLPQNLTLSTQPVQQTLMNMLGKFGVRMTRNGPDFSRSTIDPAAQKQVAGIINDVAGWGSQPGDLTPMGVDTLKRRISNMYSDNSDARALIAGVRDSAAQVLKQQVPGYAQMVGNYEKASRFLDMLGDLSLESKNDGTAIRKLTTTLRANNDYRQMLTDALSLFTPVDLKGQLAGMNLSRAGPQGIVGQIETGSSLLYQLAQGHVNPMVVAGMATASPRLMGELVKAMGQFAPYIRRGAIAAAPVTRAVAPAAANAFLNPP